MIRELLLRDFRCHARAALRLDAQPVLFEGPNGSGKSALLEAMHFACRLRSFRGAVPRDMVRRGAETFRVALATERDRLEVRWGPVGRELFLNEAPVPSASAYWGVVPCVAFSSGDARLLTGAGGERRRFLSALASQADRRHLGDLLRYGRLARQRQAVIAHGCPDRKVWETLTGQLRELGAILQRERARLVRRLAVLAAQAHGALAGAEETLHLGYRPGGWTATFEDEVRARRQLVGLQRDELEMSVAGGSARRHASEGQVRTAAIALRAAEAALLARDTGAAPVVLVDDTFGELDPARRRALVSLLPEGVPLFATLTDAAWAMAELPGARVIRLPL